MSVDELVDSGHLGPELYQNRRWSAEGNVLLGMRRTLATAKPALFVECSQAGRETAWYLLRELGYQCESAITRVDRTGIRGIQILGPLVADIPLRIIS